MLGLSHQICGAISIIISIVAFIPYLVGIYRKQVRPHLIGWLIWTLLTAVIFFVQLENGGGAGAWTTGAISAVCLVALIASLFVGDKSVRLFDWVCLALTLIAIPLWLLSGTPLYSVILMTFVEFLGFGVMTKKILIDPYSENLTYFILSIGKYVFGALALDVFSLETALYPVATVFMAIAYSALIIIRRVQQRRRVAL